MPLKMNNGNLDTFKVTYLYLSILRVILVFIPQTGYIHPDEFFQAVEVLIGKFLNVECSPPWEFNASLPIRSMTLPYFTIGMCYKFLSNFSNIGKEYLPNFSLLHPYSLLIAPRLLMCFLSFIVDYCLYQICSNNNEKYKARLVIMGSSYVMIVYATRTFSNTIELILFSLLLYFVCESMTFSNILLRKREYINFRYETSTSIAEKARFHKLKLFMVSDSYRNCFYISTVTVVGFFNRPTFLAFSVIPIFFWLYRGIGSKTITVLQFHTRMLVLLFCSLPSILFIILVDSFYYGYITWGEIGMLDVSINNFVFTPLNFLKYNTNLENLAIHGLHPWFTHFLVNIPLLFNVLGIVAIIIFLQFLYICFTKKFSLLPTVRSLKCLMTFSFVTPLVLLSIFPHQEPRFLIPLILPLVYLHGTKILPESQAELIEAARIRPRSASKQPKNNYGLLKIWFMVNGLLTVFYGFVHQGGVYQATSYLSQEMKLTPLTMDFHVVTSHIYSIPESFFMQKPSGKIYSKGKTQYTINRRLHLYEKGSKDLEHVLKLLNSITRNVKSKRLNNSKVYLLISSSLEDKLNYLIGKQYLNLRLVESFYLHVSTEAIPDVSKYCLEITQFFYKDCTILSLQEYFRVILRSCRLNLYQVTLDDI